MKTNNKLNQDESNKFRFLGYDAAAAGNFLQASYFYKQAADNYRTRGGSKISSYDKEQIRKIIVMQETYRKAGEFQSQKIEIKGGTK